MNPSSPRPDPSRRPIRVLVAAPVNSIGGQAHAARDIARGFEGDAEVSVRLQAIDPLLPGPLRWLTTTRLVRSVVRPAIYLGHLLARVPRADVVHAFCAAHTAFLFGAMPALLVGRLFGRAVVLNYHDGRAPEHFRRWPRLLPWALRQAAAVVVPSGFLRDEFARHGFACEVVPNVVDVAAYRFARRSPVPRRLVSTRSLEPLYAVENSLLAHQRLRAAYPDLQLDVYGSGSALPDLERLVAERGIGGVTFHGAIAHDAIPRALAPGGVMVNSSRVDNTPLFVLEAFAAGLPVVSTEAGGIPYLVDRGRTGLLVPLDDPGAMATAIGRLLGAPEEASALVEAARAEVERYTWPAAGQAWRALYRRLHSSEPAGTLPAGEAG